MERYSSYPVYHTVYETFEVVERFYDPSFTRLRAVAQVRGGLVFLLADSQIIPLDANQYAISLNTYARSIAAITQTHREEMRSYEVSFGKSGTSTLIKIIILTTGYSDFVCYFADSLFSAVENFTVAAREFHERLENVNRAE